MEKQLEFGVEKNKDKTVDVLNTKRDSSQDDADRVEPRAKRSKLDVALPDNVSPSGASKEESVHVCMQKIAEAAQDLHSKWKEVFRESEAFEAFAIVRVEALLKDAYALRDNLQTQKELLVARLKAVTSILENSSHSDQYTES